MSETELFGTIPPAPRVAKHRDRNTESLTAREQERLLALLLKRGGPFVKFWLWLFA